MGVPKEPKMCRNSFKATFSKKKLVRFIWNIFWYFDTDDALHNCMLNPYTLLSALHPLCRKNAARVCKIAPPDRLMCETMPNTTVNRLACDRARWGLQVFQFSSSVGFHLHSSLPTHSHQDGGDQEEDAGDEGGEGQRLRQGGRLRGAVQGSQGRQNPSLRWTLCHLLQLRASKAEGEVEELTNKARQLETELDLTKENLGIATLKLDEKEKQLSATELEMNALNRWLHQSTIVLIQEGYQCICRRVSSLEEDLEKTEEKMLAAATKLDKASTHL